jgi:hypothetical protein
MPGTALILHPLAAELREETHQPVADFRKCSFLLAYKARGTVSAACGDSGITRSEFRRWILADPFFKEMFVEAQMEVVESLEETAIKRAKASSDYLLVKLLEANKPKKYRQKIDIKQTVTTKQKWQVGGRVIEF